VVIPQNVKKSQNHCTLLRRVNRGVEGLKLAEKRLNDEKMLGFLKKFD
jgi:hypothetical protein